MDIDKAIKIFSDFLNNSWNSIQPLLSDRPYTSDESSRYEWLQANWEILVERKVLQLNEYLEVYGEGADFNGTSSRITDIDSTPTHLIKVIIDSQEDILNNLEIEDGEYIFEELTGFKDSYYTYNPPFDFVLVRDEKMERERMFPLDKVKFKLQPI